MNRPPAPIELVTTDIDRAANPGGYLLATAANRRFRVRRIARSGRFVLDRLNPYLGEWKLNAREGSTAWVVGLDFVKHGWAVLVSDDR